MGQREFNQAWRCCFICEQPFEPGSRHQVSGDFVLTAISAHMKVNIADKLVGRKEVAVCCRHFKAGHPKYMIGEDNKLKWLKTEDVLNVKGQVLYSCKKKIVENSLPKRPVAEISEAPALPNLFESKEDQQASKKQKTNWDTFFDIKPKDLKNATIFTETIRLKTFSDSAASSELLLKSVAILKQLLLAPEASIAVDEALVLVDALQSLLIGRLNESSQRESLEMGFQTERDSLHTEREKQQKEIHTLDQRMKDSLQAAHETNLKSKGWTLEAVSRRYDLFFWSGFPSKEILVDVIIPQLLASDDTQRSRGQRGLQRCINGTRLEDRCLWIFMILWRDLSLRELYSLVYKSQDYRGGFSSFVDLMKNTARFMGENALRRIHLPSEERWAELNTSAFSPSFNYQNRKFIVLDGTSLPIYKPKSHCLARSTYVHYKKHQAYRYLVGCSLDGSIVYVSQLFPGVVPDDSIYRDTNLRQILTDRYGIAEGRFGLMGDKGFIGVSPPENWVNLLTVSAQREVMNPSDQTLVPTLESIMQGRTEMREVAQGKECLTSTEVAKPRGIVEVSIGKVKRYRKLTSGHIRATDDSRFLENLVYIASYVANLHIQKVICLKGSDNPIYTQANERSIPSSSFSLSSSSSVFIPSQTILSEQPRSQV